MKNWYCCWWMLWAPLWVGAQQITVSQDILLRNDVAYELIGKMGGHTLLFRNQTTNFEVQAFNEQMQESWTKELELDKRTPRVLGIVATEDDFSLIYLFRSQGRTILKAHKYDQAANLIDSITIKDLGNLFYSPRFELVHSDDRSKLMAYYVEQQSILHVYSFDLAQMALLWETVVTPVDFFAGQGAYDMTVDNAGRMYLVLERDNFRSRRKNHYFELIHFSGSGQTTTTPVDMGDRLTYAVAFSYDNLNQELVGAGLYSERELTQADGAFFLRFNAASESEYLLQFNPFNPDFLNALLAKEYRENRGLSDVAVRDLVLRRDGGALLVIERARQLERRGATTRGFADNTMRLLIDYYYDEVVVFAINPDGSIHWQTILHKKQYSQDDDGIYSSFFMLKTPGSLRFLFNDEIRYENTVSEYVLNGLGQQDRNSLFSTEKLDLRLRFRDAVQVGAHELVAPSERRNRLKLVRLSY